MKDGRMQFGNRISSLFFICFREEKDFFFFLNGKLGPLEAQKAIERIELSDLESFFREKTSSHQHVMSRRETF
jgi:hypothetical protein